MSSGASSHGVPYNDIRILTQDEVLSPPGSCLQVLRDTLKCTLPIEIYHNGQEDVGPITRTAFKVKSCHTAFSLPDLSKRAKALIAKPPGKEGLLGRVLLVATLLILGICKTSRDYFVDKD